eukprot:177787-Chlamydomonas_euryale.AAC.5
MGPCCGTLGPGLFLDQASPAWDKRSACATLVDFPRRHASRPHQCHFAVNAAFHRVVRSQQRFCCGAVACRTSARPAPYTCSLRVL